MAGNPCNQSCNAAENQGIHKGTRRNSNLEPGTDIANRQLTGGTVSKHNHIVVGIAVVGI